MISNKCSTVTQVTQGINDMSLGDQGYVDLENLPPPPPELLQQQYLYGTVPDSRQQAVYSGMGAPQGQGVQGFTPGAGNVIVPQQQQAGVGNIPQTTTPIQVEKRSVGQEPPAPPQEFQLQPVTAEQTSAPAPAPAPATKPKPTLDAIDRQVLHNVDDHAIQVWPWYKLLLNVMII